MNNPYVRDCLQTAEVHLTDEQKGQVAARLLLMGASRACLYGFVREMGDEEIESLIRALRKPGVGGK